jgi:ABC-type transport system substrate-binding protein
MTGTGVSIGIAGCNFGNGNGDGTETDNGTVDESTPTDNPSELDIVAGGTLRVGMSGNVNSFDPPYSNDVPSTFGQSMIYEGLIVNDAEGNIYPWLADSFELVELQDIDRSAYKPYMVEAPVAEDDEGNRFIDTDEQIVVRDPDNDIQNEDTARILTPNETGDAVDDGVFGMQFQYELHEGIEFHNGEELTAENVVQTYVRYENSMLEAQTFDAFLHAEAVDDYTVNIYGQVVNAEGARELPTEYVLPTDHVDLPDGGIDPRQGTDPVGTGPYTFEEFEDEQFLRVTKNENYWLEDVGLQNKAWWDGPEDFPNSPVLDEIDINIIPDDATRSAALQNDEVDFTYGLSADTLDDFDGSEGYDLDTVQAGGYDFMQHPMNVEPWDSKKLRKGVNHLIPRSAIASNIFQDYRDPAWTPLPKLARGAGTADYDALLSTLKPMNEFDPDRGAQLVQEVIDERGLETPIEIQIETNGDNDDRVRTVELIAESMENTDLFEVTVETYEFGAFVGRILDPEYQERGHLMYVGLSGSFNPDSFCSAVNHTRNIGQCCNANGVGWDDLDRKIDEALEGQEVTENPERRAELYDEIWEIIVDRSGTSYINISSNTAVYNTDLKNFSSYPFSEGLLSYGLYAPYDDGQIAWMDSE